MAVIHTLKNIEKCGLLFRKETEDYFIKNFDRYIEICDEYSKYDGQSVKVSLFNKTSCTYFVSTIS